MCGNERGAHEAWHATGHLNTPLQIAGLLKAFLKTNQVDAFGSLFHFQKKVME